MSRCPSERRVLTLPYTICFCQRGALILMLHRRYPPFAGLWMSLWQLICRDLWALSCTHAPVAVIQPQLH